MDTIKFIWDVLHAKGFGDNASAAIMGNMKAESDLRSNNVENRSGINDILYTDRVNNSTDENYFIHDGYGYGLCQWTYSTRKRGLYRWCQSTGKSIDDIECQIEYMCFELQNDFPGLYKKLLQGDTVDKLSADFCTVYENPADKSPSVLEYRYKLSIDILNECTKTGCTCFEHAIEIVVDGVKYKAVKV